MRVVQNTLSRHVIATNVAKIVLNLTRMRRLCPVCCSRGNRLNTCFYDNESAKPLFGNLYFRPNYNPIKNNMVGLHCLNWPITIRFRVVCYITLRWITSIYAKRRFQTLKNTGTYGKFRRESYLMKNRMTAAMTRKIMTKDMKKMRARQRWICSWIWLFLFKEEN